MAKFNPFGKLRINGEQSRTINAKNLAIVVLFGALLIGIIGIVNAQQTLPKGGDGFETAVELEQGSYITDHDISRKAPEYFKLAVGAGQILAVKVTSLPTGVDIISHTVLYNEERAMLLPGYDNPLDNIYGAGKIGVYKWLTNSSLDSYVYYMSVGGGNVNFTAEGTKYDISIEDRFDAGSQTDASDTFENPMSITSGEYEAYLSGKEGVDTKDFYKTAVVIKKGEILTVKVTPPSEARMKIVVYDSDRAVLKDKAAPNPGAIVTNSVSIAKSGDVFIAVICDKYCSENVVKYTLNISIQPPAGDREPVGEEEEEEEEEVILPLGEEGEESVIMPDGAKEAAKAVGKGIAAVIIFWIIGPIILLIVIGIIIYFLLKKKKTPKV